MSDDHERQKIGMKARIHVLEVYHIVAEVPAQVSYGEMFSADTFCITSLLTSMV